MIDSFNLTQIFTGPTHSKGKKLDLVLMLGMHINNLEVTESGCSDHSFVLFESLKPLSNSPSPERPHFTRVNTSCTVMQLEEIYSSNYITYTTDLISSTMDPSLLLDVFNTTCSDILDQITPLIYRKRSDL